jgi:hypothetical protein
MVGKVSSTNSFEKQLLKFKEIFEMIEHALLTQAIVTT